MSRGSGNLTICPRGNGAAFALAVVVAAVGVAVAGGMGLVAGWALLLYGALLGGALLHAYAVWRRERKIDTCHLAATGRIYLRTREGKHLPAVATSAFIHPCLIVLCLRGADRRTYVLTLPRNMFADNLHRALRVRLLGLG